MASRRTSSKEIKLQNTNNKLLLGAIAAAALTLSACGGGGDGGSSSSPAAATPAPSPAPAPTITVSGSATPVSGDPLAVIYVPTDATSHGLSSHAGVTATAPASLQVATDNGGYKALGGNVASAVSLTSGSVSDVAGNGAYAIGRWTNGTSSLGNISVNQGAHYVVGVPLTVQRVLGPGQTLACSLISSTQPTAVSGNFAPGKVNSASAVIDLNGPLVQSINLDVSIGSDTHATATFTGGPITGAAPSATGTFQIETLGTNQTKPLLGIGYTIPSPSSGDVSGVVVLQCS